MPPTFFRTFKSHTIPHYYGDTVRVLFLVVAVLWAALTPVVGTLLPLGILFEVGGICLLVLRAGITHPFGRWIMLYNATASFVGIAVFEFAAISLYSNQTYPLFLIREFIALLLLFAFYCSVKTVRAMSLGLIKPTEEEASK